MQVTSEGRASRGDTDPPPVSANLKPDFTTTAEDWITLGLASALIGGLFLDGYAHSYVIDTATEDFFTLWHGVFYAAFAALAGWIAFVGYRRRRPGPLIDWFPSSYRLSVLGLLLFAVGGIGDGIWHTVFGVELGIDALLSPTHLVLLAGGTLLMWTPVRSSAARGDTSPWLAVGSVAIVTAVLVFFVQYLWLLPWPFYARETFNAATGQGAGVVQLFLGAAIVSTGALVGPLLLIAKRWTLPFGAAAIVWGLAATLEALAFSQRVEAILLAGLGGLAFDTTFRFGGRSRRALRAAGAAGPATLFATYILWASIGDTIGWPPEIWGGLCATAGFVGFSLVLLHEDRAPG